MLQLSDYPRAVIGKKPIDPVDDIGKPEGEIVCRQRLGGMLKFYYRRAA